MVSGGGIFNDGSASVDVLAGSTGAFYGIAMAKGNIYMIAGGSFGFSGDGGPTAHPHLASNAGLALDSAETCASPAPSTSGSGWCPAEPP